MSVATPAVARRGASARRDVAACDVVRHPIRAGSALANGVTTRTVANALWSVSAYTHE
jgi:hypothetical protein